LHVQDLEDLDRIDALNLPRPQATIAFSSPNSTTRSLDPHTLYITPANEVKMEGLDALRTTDPEKFRSLMEHIGQREKEGTFQGSRLAASD
jgi:hypothetical protein